MTSKVIQIPFKTAHLDLLHMRKHEQEVFTPDMLARLEYISGITTYLVDGRILCVAGVTEPLPGVVETHIIPSIYVLKYPTTFQRLVKNAVNFWYSQEFVTRLQAQTLATEESFRWMTELGFVCEGRMQKYLGGYDYLMWAKVK